VVVDGDRPIGTVSRSAIFEIPNEETRSEAAHADKSPNDAEATT
jgi:hypothetical protein